MLGLVHRPFERDIFMDSLITAFKDNIARLGTNLVTFLQKYKL